MKLFAKLMIAVLFIALLLPFTLLKDDSGNTLMSFSDLSLPIFSLPELSGIPGSSDISSAVEGLDGKDIFYKWYDAEGNVQFTTEPPADGIEYTVKDFDPNTNVIQAVKAPQQKASIGDPEPVRQNTTRPDDIVNPYSKESIEKLFGEAKNIEKLLNQRMKDQESGLNQ
ncbi:MAG: hypothetical protein OEO19_09865 [Gammaproteobacteria bacterium]|nr:hypothetical protein [Gammaproteobacteria bacterium]MDH3449226.1 hypothetical protein [Gammaproteobacteria bacterium]